MGLLLFSRSTLVNKEPDSMLAHMFKDKGEYMEIKFINKGAK